MKLIKMDPPGTFCANEAVMDMIKSFDPPVKTFVEVGCGAGDLSRRLCENGYHGAGIDFSERAIEQAKKNLALFIERGQYQLFTGDIMDPKNRPEKKFDLGISMMVMEHVEDDKQFISNIASVVKPGGQVMVGVPGRRDRWGIEDETVGHLRRYDRNDLIEVLLKAQLKEVDSWSVSVPVANLLFNIGNRMVEKSDTEMKKRSESLREQTETSGIREIPFKTAFPAWCKIILNRYSLYPLFVIQRMFYKTNLGLTMIGHGKV